MKDKTLLFTMGEKIKQKRKEAGLSQTELGEKVGYVSKSTLSHIEKGKRDISTPQLKKIAKALNVSVDYLLENENDDYIVFNYHFSQDEARAMVKKISKYYSQLNQENQKVAENYIKFLLENQNKGE